jgi:putative oxidoreductase
MNNLEHTRAWIKGHADTIIDLMRIYLGIGLFWKGLYFMMHRDELTQLMDQLGNLWFVPMAIAHYVVPVHLVGGALLALGLLTRVAALSQIPILLGAVFYVYLPRAMYFEPRQSLEFSVLVLFLLCLVFAYGAGRLSVDYVLSKKSIEPDAVPATI